MKKLIVLILFLVLPLKVNSMDINATSAILMDMETGRILYADNIHEVRSVASISKVMTAVLAIESGKLDDVVTIGDEIDASYGSGVYITKGEKLTLRDLVYALMLRSGNDAALAIADYVGGKDFIEMMNNKASEIGMLNSSFNNPSGLDEVDGNYSTSYDMAVLTSYAMSLSEYKKITNTKVYKLKTNKNTYNWINKHKLLNTYEYITGGKTGFTKKAKRTLITTASKDHLNLVAVTLNDGNDFSDHLNLINYGFENYHKKIMLKKGKLNIYDDIYYGIYDLKIDKDIYYPVTKEDKIILKYQLEKSPKIGVTGTVILIVNEKEVARKNIYGSIKQKQQKKNLYDWFKSLW